MLDYTKVLETLKNSGILTRLTELEHPGVIIELGSDILNRLGLIIANHSVLLITKEGEQFFIYQQNISSPFDKGKQGLIWAGTNIQTGAEVAIKSEFRFFKDITKLYQYLPIGLVLAKDRLSKYPYFVKIHVLGFVFEMFNNLTVIPVRDNEGSDVKNYQIMERIKVGFNLRNSSHFEFWTGAQIHQIVVEALDAFELLFNENIENFDHHDGNYLVDINGRLKLCDYNSLIPLRKKVSLIPEFKYAINLLFSLYGKYKQIEQGSPKILAAGSIIKNILLSFQKDHPSSKEEIITALDDIIAACEKQKCIIQCELETSVEVNQAKENYAIRREIKADEFCHIFCEKVDITDNRTIKERITHFITPQTEINWNTVSSHVLQSSFLTFSTELIRDGLNYYSAPKWLTCIVDHAVKDSWMWSQGSAYSVLTTSMSIEICDALGLSTNIKAALGVTAGLCTNVLIQYPTTTIATSVVSTVASLLTSTISFWGEKKFAKKMGIINDNAEQLALYRSQQCGSESIPKQSYSKLK